jgi:superfamily II RNA helicase
MPARTVVFDSLRKFDGVAFDWLRTRDYLQMAGRAGRQGIDLEGRVVSVVDTEDLLEAPLERIVRGSLEPVRSRFNLAYATLLRLTEHLGERIEEAWERSFNRYQFESGGAERRDRNRARQLDLLRRKLQFLHATAFLEAGRLTDRGRVAARLAAYEIQIADALLLGIFEELSPRLLAAAFVGFVYEQRKGETIEQRVPPAFATTKRRIHDSVRALKREERRLDIADGIQRPDFSLTEATFAWCEGDPIDALGRHSDAAPGDLVRTFRMAIQCLRQLAQELPTSYPLRGRIDQAIALLNRDEVDARAQLELG